MTLLEDATVDVHVDADERDQLKTLISVAATLRAAMLNPATSNASPARWVCSIRTDFAEKRVIVESAVPNRRDPKDVIHALSALLAGTAQGWRSAPGSEGTPCAE